MNTLTVLVSGFAAFDNSSVNPSWLAVEALPEQIGSCRLVKIQLPVSFSTAFSDLEKAIEASQPDLVICVGLAIKRSDVSIERVAINLADARIPDNEGCQPVDRIIDYTAPNAYFGNLPGREIVRRIDRAGLSASLSESAGTFVCNQVMFKLLHLINSQLPHMMGGFIHVPALPEMLTADSRTAGMPLEKIVSSLIISIQTCAEDIASGKWKGTKISIVPYSSKWPEEFAEISTTLKRGLGEMALRIDHIGSTSVPGLAAKDIIDVQITVNKLDDRLLQAMETMGYTRAENIANDHVPPGMITDTAQWQKWFFRAPAGQRRTNTHVRLAGRANQRFPLLFRDFLCAHPQTAAAYGELKKRLAANIANSSMYPDVKDPAVDLIYFPAERWAEQTGWKC